MPPLSRLHSRSRQFLLLTLLRHPHPVFFPVLCLSCTCFRVVGRVRHRAFTQSGLQAALSSFTTCAVAATWANRAPSPHGTRPLKRYITVPVEQQDASFSRYFNRELASLDRASIGDLV